MPKRCYPAVGVRSVLRDGYSGQSIDIVGDGTIYFKTMNPFYRLARPEIKLNEWLITR